MKENETSISKFETTFENCIDAAKQNVKEIEKFN